MLFVVVVVVTRREWTATCKHSERPMNEPDQTNKQAQVELARRGHWRASAQPQALLANDESLDLPIISARSGTLIPSPRKCFGLRLIESANDHKGASSLSHLSGCTRPLAPETNTNTHPTDQSRPDGPAMADATRLLNVAACIMFVHDTRSCCSNLVCLFWSGASCQRQLLLVVWPAAGQLQISSTGVSSAT